MRVLRQILVLAWLWFLPAQLNAAFTLEQIFEFAAKKSEILKIGQLDIERQFEAGAESKTRLGPRIKLQGELARNYSKLGTEDFQSQTQPSLITEIRQPLYEGGGIKAQQDSAEHLGSIARWDLQAQRDLLYRQLAEVFYQVLGADQDLSNLRESAEIYRKRVKLLEQRALIGKSRQAEVLSARTQMDALLAQIQAVTSMRDRAERRLSELSGLSGVLVLDDRLKLVNSNRMAQVPPIEIPTVEAARARIALADSRIEEKKSILRPRLDLITEHSWRYPIPDEKQFNRLHFAVGLTWTLYDAGEADAAIRGAILDKQKALIGEALQTRDTEYARVEADRSYRDGLEQIRLYEKAFYAAEKNLKIQQLEFDKGLLTNLEIMQALDTRLQIKRSRDQAIYQTKLALVELNLFNYGVPKLVR